MLTNQATGFVSLLAIEASQCLTRQAFAAHWRGPFNCERARVAAMGHQQPKELIEATDDV